MSQVSVIIPNYNGIKYLPDCLDSLTLEQETFDFDVIVIDNGSTDGSVELLKERYAQVKSIFLAENTGFCHACNLGMRESKAEYVLLLNNDTKVFPGFVKSLYESISAKEDAFSVSAKMLMWDKPELLDGAGDLYCALGWARARGKGKSAAEYETATEIFSACGGAAIYRKRVLDQIGLLDEAHFAYLEDLDLGYRAKINGYRNYYEPKARVIHYGSASTGSRYNAWKTKQAAANNVYVIYKNMPLLQLLINLPFLVPGFLVKWLFFLKKGWGKEYLDGIKTGFSKCGAKEGKAAKVPFLWKNLGSYFRIQWQLYIGIFQIIMKS